MQTFDDVKFISREVKLIYGNKTREKCFDMLCGESIENVGNRNTRPVVAKGSDDSVFTNSVVSAIRLSKLPNRESFQIGNKIDEKR